MDDSSDDEGWNVRVDHEGVRVALTGDWVVMEHVRYDIGEILDAAGDRGISFESDRLGRWDSALLVFLSALRQGARQRDIPFHDEGLPKTAVRLLALTAGAAPLATRPPENKGLADRVGETVIGMTDETLAVLSLVGDTVLSGGTAARGRLRMRGEDLSLCMREAGASALPIVTVVNLLIGSIIAFVGAVQLRRFGADIFVADLVGVAMVREMTALMTGIVMSGRTGGAYAAHIATMLGNEEIDALRAFGIPVHDYLILPRMIALTCMMPLLYLYGCAVGIFGGFIVSISMLNLSPNTFIEEIRVSFGGDQIVFGLVKSIAFGALIAIVGCRSGLSAGRTAADVGRAATTAVVIGIVGVIALDAVFAVCANALDF